MRITVLTYLDPSDPRPDDVVPQVVAALKARGHEAALLDVGADVAALAGALLQRKADLVFNLAEEFGTTEWGDAAMPALLDLLALPCTGSRARCLYVTQDKVLTKKILAFEEIATPRFAVFSKSDRLETGGNLRLPLFVKPLRMESSIGIDARASLVSDVTGLLERVRMIHEEIGDAALAEEYVPGREFYVGVLGNDALQALPIVEMDFSGLPEGALHVADWAAKWDESSPEYRGTRSVLADVPDELKAQLHETALRAYRCLGMRGYGRIDLRVTPTGEIVVLEANANPYLERSAELAMAAKAHGLQYEDLIARIVELAVEKPHRAPAQAAAQVHEPAQGAAPAEAQGS